MRIWQLREKGTFRKRVRWEFRKRIKVRIWEIREVLFTNFYNFKLSFNGSHMLNGTAISWSLIISIKYNMSKEEFQTFRGSPTLVLKYPFYTVLSMSFLMYNIKYYWKMLWDRDSIFINSPTQSSKCNNFNLSEKNATELNNIQPEKGSSIL